MTGPVVIAIDAMGSDRAPGPDVAGAVAAVREAPVEVELYGDRPRLEAELARIGASGERAVRVIHAPEVVGGDEHAAAAFRSKRASSLRLAIDRVHRGGAAALVSAGNSGAVLAHALFVLGRSRGVERPALVTVFPTTAGPLTLCDVGANVEPRPSMLAQFGVLGAAYDRVVHGRARPRVGLLANGTEPGKGTELTRAAAPLLAAAAARGDFQFVGYVEGSGLWDGAVDVVATDGFTGNVVLKACEGVATALFGLVRQRLTETPRAKLGGALVAPALRDLGRRIDFAETGGALLAGVDGVVVIAHGRSDTTAMKNAVLMAARFARADLSTRIAAVVEHTVEPRDLA
ncbi:MAG: phosphate acyltransferase PlsX [Myxococcales bacterium]|nr:phosphate acyltransferase PlsX [Myxococcales bacterium]